MYSEFAVDSQFNGVNCRYLSDLPTEICNKTGLSKVLMTRRETIRLKHLQKNLFVYNKYGQVDLVKKLKYLQFRDLFQYMEFLSNRLRGIYKYPRSINVENVDKIVKQKDYEFTNTVRLYTSANPVIVLDFDKTITNQKFHSLYRWLTEVLNIKVIINTANPSREVVLAYLRNHELKMPSEIYNNEGKQKKLVNLKNLASRFYKRPLFYVDDEVEYIDYANLLFYQCYLYTNRGEILSRTLNMK